MRDREIQRRFIDFIIEYFDKESDRAVRKSDCSIFVQKIKFLEMRNKVHIRGKEKNNSI